MGLQGEEGDFGAHVKAHGPGIAQGAVDVEETAVFQIKTTGRVPLVVHRQHRRGQERWFDLAAVSVPAQYVSLVAVPDRLIGDVRIVTEYQVGLVGV